MPVKLFRTSIFFLICLTVHFAAVSQQDSSRLVLEPIEVRAFDQNKAVRELPASVAIVSPGYFDSHPSTSVVQAVQTIPGARVEERSPGSYRINIRGSSLRSPFGVRNIKIYYNDLPITEPGGNTYFNALGFYNFGILEILKSPGSSLYGAGTGGVMFIEGKPMISEYKLEAELSQGSFNTKQVMVAANLSTNRFRFQYLGTGGFRSHSEMNRKVFDWAGHFQLGARSFLTTTVLFSDLFYETPGALTIKEFNTERRWARPAAGIFPGAEESKASIEQKTFLAGASLRQQLSTNISFKAVGYGMFTQLENPSIRNYGINRDPHFGGRTSLTWNKSVGTTTLQLVTGGEVQHSFSEVAVFDNKKGKADSIRSLDDVNTRHAFAFLQSAINRPGWELSAGLSLNGQNFDVTRRFPAPQSRLSRTFTNILAPRLALSKKIGNNRLYAAISRGFSPPTLSEFLPSGSPLNLSLKPETGINYEVGYKGLTIGKVYADLNAFYFSTSGTIVQRRDAGGGDYFINAGSTDQKGMEAAFHYKLKQHGVMVRDANIRLAYTYHDFRYEEFLQLNNDYSGNRLPGVPLHTLFAGADIHLANGFFSSVSYFSNSSINLNDANSARASGFGLLGFKLGFEKNFGSTLLRLVVAGENLFDEIYSLGYDLNAFGGRYFNAAPGRNFSVTARIEQVLKKKPSNFIGGL